MRKRAPYPVVPAALQAILEAEGYWPTFQQLQALGATGVTQMRELLTRFPRSAVTEAVEQWCGAAMVHHLEVAMDSPLERARVATQLDRELAAGEISPQQHQQGMRELQPYGGRPTDRFVQQLSTLSDQELQSWVASVPERAKQAGLTADQYIQGTAKMANQGARTKVFSHDREVLAEQALRAYGLKRDPGHSAQATLQRTLRDVLDGNSDLSKQLPFDTRPSAAKDRDGVLAEFVKSANNTTLGRTFQQRGWDLRSFLAEQLSAAQNVDIADGVLGRMVKRDVQRPQIREQPSREQSSRDRLRATLEAKVSRMEPTRPQKRIQVDNSREAAIRAAMHVHEGKDPARFRAEHYVPEDVQQDLNKNDLGYDAPPEHDQPTSSGNLHADVAAAYDRANT